MHWLYIALLAPALSAFGNYTDKYLVSSGTKGSGIDGIILFSCFFGIVVIPLALLFDREAYILPVFDALLLMANGALAILALVAYLYAIKDGDVVSVVPVLQSIPVFGFLLGYTILGETLSNLQLVGSGVILSGALLLSLEISEEGVYRVRKKNLFLALLSSFFYALSGVVFKFVAIDQGYWAAQFWEYVGMGVLGLILLFVFSRYRRILYSLMKLGKFRFVGLNLASESSMVASDLLLNYATLLAPIALVYTVNSFQPAFLLVYGALGLIFFPRIMKQLSHSSKGLWLKMLTICIMIGGAILLYL